MIRIPGQQKKSDIPRGCLEEMGSAQYDQCLCGREILLAHLMAPVKANPSYPLGDIKKLGINIYNIFSTEKARQTKHLLKKPFLDLTKCKELTQAMQCFKNFKK